MVFTRLRMILRSQSTFNTPFMELKPTKRKKHTISKSMILRSEATKHTKFLELTKDVKRIHKKSESNPEPEPDSEPKPGSVASPILKIKKEPELVIEELDVSIDFDDAHNCWMANKKKKGNGTYSYTCCYILPNGKKCFRSQCDLFGIYSGCKKHYMWEEKQQKYDSVYI